MGLPKCEHGVARGDGRYVGAWAAPFSECGCCGVSFPYLDSLGIGPGYAHGRTWTPKDRCQACGGAYVEWEQGERPKPLPLPSDFAESRQRADAGRSGPPSA